MERTEWQITTWQVKDIKVTVIGQNRAAPLVSQTCDLPVSLSWTLDQRDASLGDDLNEDISCEDGKNRTIAAVTQIVRLLYLGLQTLTQSWKLLVTGVNPSIQHHIWLDVACCQR